MRDPAIACDYWIMTARCSAPVLWMLRYDPTNPASQTTHVAYACLQHAGAIQHDYEGSGVGWRLYALYDLVGQPEVRLWDCVRWCPV